MVRGRVTIAFFVYFLAAACGRSTEPVETEEPFATPPLESESRGGDDQCEVVGSADHGGDEITAESQLTTDALVVDLSGGYDIGAGDRATIRVEDATIRSIGAGGGVNEQAVESLALLALPDRAEPARKLGASGGELAAAVVTRNFLGGPQPYYVLALFAAQPGSGLRHVGACPDSFLTRDYASLPELLDIAGPLTSDVLVAAIAEFERRAAVPPPPTVETRSAGDFGGSTHFVDVRLDERTAADGAVTLCVDRVGGSDGGAVCVGLDMVPMLLPVLTSPFIDLEAWLVRDEREIDGSRIALPPPAADTVGGPDAPLAVLSVRGVDGLATSIVLAEPD